MARVLETNPDPIHSIWRRILLPSVALRLDESAGKIRRNDLTYLQAKQCSINSVKEDGKESFVSFSSKRRM
jgi:hypothetical protein